MLKIRWSQQDIEKLKMVYKHTKYEDLEIMFGRKSSYINMKAKSLGLKKLSTLYGNDGVSALLENTPQAFYWVGFILADGHVSNARRLIVRLNDKDANHLQKLADVLNHNIKHFTKSTNFKKDAKVAELSIMDTKNIKQLITKFGISNTKTINPPPLSEYEFEDTLLISLLLGFIDGDGNITKRKPHNNLHYIRLKCHANWYSNFTIMRDLICRYFLIDSVMMPKINKAGFVELTISDNKIIRAMKTFALVNNIPILERKWQSVILN